MMPRASMRSLVVSAQAWRGAFQGNIFAKVGAWEGNWIMKRLGFAHERLVVETYMRKTSAALLRATRL
jgi:hypothetical protein